MISSIGLRIRWRKGSRICHAHGSCGVYPRHSPHHNPARDIGLYGTTPCLCSCWMCGNPRRWQGNSRHGKTMQERKAMEAMSDE